MFGAARPINVFTDATHRGLRDLQNLSTFCFAVNLVGLALTWHVRPHVSPVNLMFGIYPSNLTLDASAMDQASLRSPVTKHFPEQCRLRAWDSGIREAQYRGRLCMFVVQHRRARAHEVDIPQSCHRAMEKLCRALFVLANALSGNAFGLRPFTLCRVSFCVTWKVMLSRVVSCPLALCRCGYESVLLPGVFLFAVWTLTVLVLLASAQQCFSCMR